MSPLRALLLAISTISFFTFVAFFGRLPAFRNTPIGFLSRVLWIHVPSFLTFLDRKLLRGSAGPWLARAGHRIVNDKHPSVMIFFLGLVTGAFFLLVYHTWPFLRTSQRICFTILLPTPYIFTGLCARSSPELQITRLSHPQRLLDYPYDLTIFHPGKICRTCRFEKPARSKHCSICKVCVARADHHCVWVNNCVGRGNYLYFLLLLLCTGLLLMHGAHTSYSVLAPIVQEDRRWRELPAAGTQDSVFERTIGRTLDWVNLAIVKGGLSIAGVGMLCLFTTALPFGLLAYHVYLIWLGMTTNETSKWEDLKYNIRAYDFYKARLRAGVAEWAAEPLTHRIDRLGYHEVSYPLKKWPVDPHYLVHCFEERPERRGGPCPDTTVGKLAHPQATNDDFDSMTEGEWKQVNKISDLENVYDVGFVDNLVDIIMH